MVELAAEQLFGEVLGYNDADIDILRWREMGRVLRDASQVTKTRLH